MVSIFPINHNLAAKAFRLSQKGIKGKAAAEKLGKGMRAPQANLLASVGYENDRDETAALTSNEINVLLALAEIERERRNAGETSTTKAKFVAPRAGISLGQLRRITKKRLNERTYEYSTLGWVGRFGYVNHSKNGHIWLTDAGWGMVRVLEGCGIKIIKTKGKS